MGVITLLEVASTKVAILLCKWCNFALLQVAFYIHYMPSQTEVDDGPNEC